jgi:hypothetical protein
MYRVTPNLKQHTLAAGEPLVLEVQFLTSGGMATDIADTSMVLTIYKGGDRAVLLQRIGEAEQDGDGSEFFRFAIEGDDTEKLTGNTGMMVELSRRLRHGREVVAVGSIVLDTSAATVPSLDNAAIAETAQRVRIKKPLTLGGELRFELETVQYAPESSSPEAAFTAQPTITPSTGEAGVTTFTATPGVVSNGSISSRVWLLNGTSISTGLSASPTGAGTLTYQEFAAFAESNVVSATVAAATSTPTPTPTAIAATQITQTSAAGASPFAWELTNDPTFMPGFYAHVQRTSQPAFPAISDRVVINGDSWDGSYAAYYAGAWAAANPALKISNISYSGRSIGTLGTADMNTLVATEGQVIAGMPGVYYAGIGANDLFSYPSGTAYATALKAHFQRIKDALPGVLLVGRTPCARQMPGADSANAAHNANRPALVAAMRQWLADGFLTGLVDFAANASIGDDADMIPVAAGNTAISTDGLHLYDAVAPTTGHGIASPIFAAEMNRVVAMVPKLSGEAIQQLTPQDLAGGDMTFADLGSTPVGPLKLRVRIGRENGTGGYVWGPWGNTLSDTIAPSFNGEFNPAKKTGTVTLSNNNRMMTAANQGYNYSASAVGNVALSAPIGIVEFTVVDDSVGSDWTREPLAFGIVPGSFDPTNNTKLPLYTQLEGGYYFNGARLGPGGAYSTGAKVMLVVHKATSKAWIQTPAGWFPDVPEFNADSSIKSGIGIATGFVDFYFAAQSRSGDSASVNAGQDAFTLTRPANTPGGWA